MQWLYAGEEFGYTAVKIVIFLGGLRNMVKYRQDWAIPFKILLHNKQRAEALFLFMEKTESYACCSASALSVFSQVKSGNSRPKWP